MSIQTLYLRVLLCVLSLVFVVVPIYAQEVVIGDLQTFEAAGQQHVIAWSFRNANTANRTAVREAITQTVQVYNRLFGTVARRTIPMRIYVYLHDDPKSGNPAVLAEAERRTGRIPTSPLEFGPEQTFCYVNLYNTPFSTNQDVLKFTIAHEIGHCYQGFYLPAANPTLPDYREADFWIEGSVEWLATQVYPAPDAGGMNAYRASFVNNNGKDLLSGDFEYDGVFYWGYLANAHSPEYVVGRLLRLPRDKDELPAYFNQPTAVEGEFARWGRSLALGRVPYQPPASELYATTWDAMNPPANTSTEIAPRAFNIIAIRNLNSLSPDLGLEVTIRGNRRANGIYIATLDQEFPPSDDESDLKIMFCTRGSGQFLAIGRDSVGTGNATLSISVAQKTCDDNITSVFTVPRELTNPSPNCYQGTWALSHWPIPQGNVFVTSYGTSHFNVDESGNFELELNEIELRVDQGVFTRLYDIRYQGTLTAAQVNSTSATFKVTLNSGALVGTPRATIKIGGGAEQTISSDAFTNAFRQIRTGVSGVLTLVCREESTLEYRLNVPGTTVSYFFTRTTAR